MSDPTRAQLRTDLQNATEFLQHILDAGRNDADSVVGLYNTYLDNRETDHYAARSAGADAVRSAYAATISSERVRAIITPVLLDWADLIGAPNNQGAGVILSRMYDDFIDNSETLQSRQITYGSPSAAGGNTGNGEIVRLTLDEHNQAIEAIFPEDSYEAEIVADQNSGREMNNELFQIRTTSEVGTDLLDIKSSGLTTELEVASPQKVSKLQNPSFDSGSSTALPGWRLLDSANAEQTPSASLITVDTTNIYLPAPDDSVTRQSLQLDSTSQIKVEQKLNLRRETFNTNVPHVLQIAWNREVNGASGTLQIHMGSTSGSSITVSAQTGWQTARLTIDQNLWLRQANEDELDILIDWTPDSGGTGLLIDDVIFAPMTPVGGTWYMAIPGRTPFLYEDTFTWSDSFASGIDDGVIQYWLWRGYGRYLPHDNSNPTIADPS